MKPNESAKPVLVAPAANSKDKSADADETVTAAPPKTGFLPTGLSRAMVIGSVLLVSAVVAVGLFGDRYTLISAQRSENAIVYRIDRMTGQVSFCSPAGCSILADKADGPK